MLPSLSQGPSPHSFVSAFLPWDGPVTTLADQSWPRRCSAVMVAQQSACRFGSRSQGAERASFELSPFTALPSGIMKALLVMIHTSLFHFTCSVYSHTSITSTIVSVSIVANLRLNRPTGFAFYPRNTPLSLSTLPSQIPLARARSSLFSANSPPSTPPANKSLSASSDTPTPASLPSSTPCARRRSVPSLPFQERPRSGSTLP